MADLFSVPTNFYNTGYQAPSAPAPLPAYGGGSLGTPRTRGDISLSIGGSPGGSYPYAGTSLTPIPSTQEQTQATTKSGSTAGTTVGSSATQQQQLTDSLNTTIFDKSNMTSQDLQALQAIIAGGGQNELITAQEEAKKQQMLELQAMIAGMDPSAAGDRAAGEVADLSRQLLERALPELFGGAEMAGFGGDALTNLMAGDQAIRTGEAQQRAREGARTTAQDQLTQGNLALTQLLGQESQSMTSMLEALGISKGAVERGSEVTTGREKVAGTSTTTSREDTRERTGERADTVASATALDPLAWAKLQAELAAITSGGGASEGELALALFNASKTPFQTLGDLQFGGQYGTGDLMATIKDFL